MSSSASGRRRAALFSSFSSRRIFSDLTVVRKSRMYWELNPISIVRALIVDVQLVPRLADLRVGRKQPEPVLFERELDAPGPLGGEQRNPADGVRELLAAERRDVRVVFGDDRFEIGEFALDDPGDERPVPAPEEEIVLVHGRTR